MRFLHPERDELLELALEDVFIVPDLFEGGSRLDVDLTPDDFAGGSHPIVAANMNAVTGKRMAETMARLGGLGVLPQDMSLATVERIVAHVHAAHPRFDTPLVVGPDATLRDVQGLIHKRAHDMVVVLEDHRPVGILTGADLLERDQYTPAAHAMSVDVVTLSASDEPRAMYETLRSNRVRSAPVVDERGHLVGIVGRLDPVRQSILEPALDGEGRLQIAAAVGINAGSAKRAAALVEMGVSCVVVDTAHGHQRKMLDVLAEVRKAVGPSVPLVAGNVCTARGTRALLDAGADIVKVNVGPGAMCTTRMQTGVGRPSFSSVLACAREAHSRGAKVWADGGVKHPRDVALYLAAGASRVMVGTALAGTFESPGDLRTDPEGRRFKENYGMASARAVSDRTEKDDAFTRARKGFFREGISTSKIYLRNGFESVADIVVDMISGVRSTFTYVGASDLDSLRERVVVGVQTPSGYGEGTPHGRER
ncbi:MAG: GuaB1 family IMP dehydrogenase-related protein [Sandaracinus sp.]|nr:GuaB1 family IMP dehydrogenase-related protein [Sandaracinus sp.]|tara:strand:+ start:4749 stop:6191 length:1443 start_codon:yes stop_codon:yes gene_type:complete